MISKVNKHKIRLRAIRTARQRDRSRRDVEDMRAMCARTPVGDSRMVAQQAVRVCVPQGLVDLVAVVDRAITVRLRREPRGAVPLVPQSRRPGGLHRAEPGSGPVGAWAVWKPA